MGASRYVYTLFSKNDEFITNTYEGERMPRIEEIKLPDSLDYFSGEEPFNSLRGISRLNAFVGPNNSGKSNLLRKLFIQRKALMIATDHDYSIEICDNVRLSLQLAEQCKERLPFVDAIFDALREVDDAFHQVSTNPKANEKRAKLLSDMPRKVYERWQGAPQGKLRESLSKLRSTLSHLVALLNGGPKSLEDEPRFENTQFVYVPTLRGMRLSSGDDDLSHAYFDRTYTDYFQRSSASAAEARGSLMGTEIVTGLDLYKAITNKLLGNLADRQFVRSYEKFLSNTFFQGQPVALIPRQISNTLHIKVGNEKERGVERLGDGLQQLVILTLPLFQHADVPLFLFIEEPDLFLHPGYQRVLIDTITAEPDRDLYVFVTTHSPQFLDITLEEKSCAVFRCEKDHQEDDTAEDVEKDPTFTVTNVGIGNHDLLNQIGVRPSSVFLSNCTIWVEGITDRLYFGRYLELMLKKNGLHFTENLHYTFVEYGGGNITHWSFLDVDEGIDVERLCARLFLIADRDEGKEKRHKRLQAALGERSYILKARETENLLSPSVIAAVIRDYEGEDFELKEYEQEAYQDKYLGRFIENHVLVDKMSSKRLRKEGADRPYSELSGTIKSKVAFCRKALTHINTFDEMSDEAKLVAEKLIGFIDAQNA